MTIFLIVRTAHGGGILFYVNDQLESHLLKYLTDSKHESLWIKVCLDKTKPILFSAVYRPHSGSDLERTDNLCAYLEQCDKKNFLEKKRFSFVVI